MNESCHPYHRSLARTVAALLACLTLTLGLLWPPGSLAAPPPGILNHRGIISAAGAAFEGVGQFKFALVNAAGDMTFWSNDGASTVGDEPVAAVSLTVTDGHYTVALGDTTLANMTAAIPADKFRDEAELYLRIWFDDGVHGFQQLSPDQRIVSVGYALSAANATVAETATVATSAGSVDASNVTGTLDPAQLPAAVVLNGASGVNLSGSFSGDGSGLTGVPGTATPRQFLTSWGSDVYGQVADTPATATFAAVAAGSGFSVAIRSDGSLISWGLDHHGQVSQVPTDGTYRAVAAGQAHGVAITAAGALVSWGADDQDQVSQTPSGGTYLAVAAGRAHSVAITTEGALVSWGTDEYGQVSQTPTSGTYLAVAAGWNHCVALAADGSLHSWGDNADGKVSQTPTGTYVAVAAGIYHSVALRSDGSLVSWGWNGHSQVSQTPTSGTYRSIAAGGHQSVAIASDGSLASWGWDAARQVSKTPASGAFLAVAVGLDHAVALRQADSFDYAVIGELRSVDGEVNVKAAVSATAFTGDGAGLTGVPGAAEVVRRIVSWGTNDDGLVTQSPTGGSYLAVAAGAHHSVALRSDGSLTAWGWDVHGQVGQTPASGTFVGVAAGDNHNVAIRSDGSLVSWGSNNHTQVSTTPTTGDYVAVAGGGQHSVAIRSDGRLVSWGYQGFGLSADTPTGTYTAVAAGYWHSVAIRSDGALVSWGDDSYGQISGTPTGTYVAVAAGAYFSVAISSSGSLVSWGRDNYGQVSLKPTTGVYVAVAAGLDWAVAVKSDGSLVAWGRETHGELTQRPTGGGFVAVAAGEDHALALRASGHFGTQAAGYVVVGGNLGVGREPAVNRLEVEGQASKTTSGSWLANSDRRIKQDILPVTNALDTLDRVRLVSFDYTDEYRARHPAVDDRRYLNVIAQEFAEVFPEHVRGSGDRLPDGSEILQVDIHPLTIYSAAAIQELRAVVRAKEARIAALEERLISLEAQQTANARLAAEVASLHRLLDRAVLAEPSPAPASQLAAH